jgi:hypothetical protein
VTKTRRPLISGKKTFGEEARRNFSALLQNTMASPLGTSDKENTHGEPGSPAVVRCTNTGRMDQMDRDIAFLTAAYALLQNEFRASERRHREVPFRAGLGWAESWVCELG